MAKFGIWYMRAEWFRDGYGQMPNAANLEATHIHLKDLELEGDTALERVFEMMQAEHWSPNGEARKLIKSKGLHHTSMSPGDVIVDDTGRTIVVAMFGFKEIK